MSTRKPIRRERNRRLLNSAQLESQIFWTIQTATVTAGNIINGTISEPVNGSGVASMLIIGVDPVDGLVSTNRAITFTGTAFEVDVGSTGFMVPGGKLFIAITDDADLRSASGGRADRHPSGPFGIPT